MKTKNPEQIAQEFFENHPDVERIYVTTDGFVFVSKNYADLHAKTSGKKVKIKTFYREGVKLGQEPDAGNGGNPETPEQKKKDTKSTKTKK